MMDRCSCLLMSYRTLALLSLGCRDVARSGATCGSKTIAYVALQQAHCKRASLQQSNKHCTPWRQGCKAAHKMLLRTSLRSMARVRRASTAAAAAPRCVVELISDTM